MWLIFVEFTMVGTAWTFRFPWGFFGVIWALGASMVLLSVLVKIPVRWLAAIAGAVIVLHDRVDTVLPTGSWSWMWNILHVKGEVVIEGFHRYVLFRLVPWFAVMALGYWFGLILVSPHRRPWLAGLATALTFAFVLLRSANLYGNPPALPGGVSPGDFHVQATAAKTLILFLD